MKYVVEFGVRGGAHVDNLIVPTAALAADIARGVVMTMTNDPHHHAATLTEWRLPRHCERRSWTNATHFVSVSRLDGVPRGPASATLWRK
jgi:hypothetical protein